MSNQKFIPLSVPNISGNEWKYVKDCLDTGWISSVGSYVTKFEEEVAKYVGAKYGIAAVNGTAAIHICLKLIGVGLNDYVIMPNITFVATANAIKYTGADPILIDADPDDWQMDLELLENFLQNETAFDGEGHLIHKKDRRKIKAILPVHVQGNIGNMDHLMEIANKYHLPIIEDSAEALGSTYKGQHAGTFGLMGCLSFNGNKIISTGGGGIILTSDDKLAQRAKHITTTAKTNSLEYHHDEVGFNYRLVNVLAAIGVAQMEGLDKFIARKKEIGAFYRENLNGVADIRFQQIRPDVSFNNWLFTIQTKHQKKLISELNAQNIVCRPFWMPMYKLPMYSNCIYVSKQDNCDYIHKTCMAIPCSTSILDEELEIVTSQIKKIVA
ncbi:MAG: LegC family aminotransferase [Bacteroidetes bacterium]|jgi:perosamine synthetase|nr:LegC family aminotransferase [Bacteroidota bacterium]